MDDKHGLDYSNSTSVATRPQSARYKSKKQCRRPDVDLLRISFSLQSRTYEEELRKMQKAKPEQDRRMKDAAMAESARKVDAWLNGS